MQQLIDLWLGMDLRRRVTLVAVTLVVFASVLGLSRLVNAPNYALLYSGLDASASGEVVAALEQQGVNFQVRGASIYVPSDLRDELRMVLAADGLPNASGQGYELLDSLSGFGTTAQMFDAAYWRAKEGELARTVQSSTSIKSARVHIANTTTQPFRPAQTASASVTAVASGGGLTPENATAMRYLVASAVAGLAPENVTVIDGRTGAVVGADQLAGAQNASDRAAELRRNILRLLEPRVGVGRAIVEVNIENVTEAESVSERIFDPETRVPISTETEETSNSVTGSGSGAISVASNLPEGDAGPGAQTSSNQGSTTRETVNYELSETRREIVRAPGAIKRISVAVLVDGIEGTDAETGAPTWQPRPESEIAALRDLVASAMGYDAARGDALTLQNMQLTLPEYSEEPASVSLVQSLGLDVMRLIQVAVLAVVSLVLGLFVLRPLLMKPPQLNEIGPTAELPGPPVVPQPALQPPGAAPSEDGAAPGGLPELPMMGMPKIAIGNAMGGGSGMPSPSEDPVARLKSLIEERQDEAVEILEGWMNDEGETA